MNETVVIGYGNDLRSDDGIGWRVANAIAQWNLPRVQSLAVQQLTPELAAVLAKVDLVIFVDACWSFVASKVQVQTLSPVISRVIDGHIGDGRSLLALTEAIYGHCPAAWLVTVPGVNFEVGENLSPIAEMGIAVAQVEIMQLLLKQRQGKRRIGNQ